MRDIIYPMKRNKNVMEQLRQAVKQSGLSINAISKRTKLPYAVVHGLVRHRKSVTVITLEKIAAALELDIILQPKSESGKKA